MVLLFFPRSSFYTTNVERNTAAPAFGYKTLQLFRLDVIHLKKKKRKKKAQVRIASCKECRSLLEDAECSSNPRYLSVLSSTLKLRLSAPVRSFF